MFLGFGLNVALLIMKAIIKTDELMKRAMSAYLDDIYINEDLFSVDEV